eukprot:TRINITY_DN3885_c0_g1_i2.p1 TRINITY_DN3885_c0_g1~~TRINITY_DN3885_c0_g1_i2.p1  ORF type:complete len:122 (+),score=3.81 TRINITY_DN3885_c0_g1_i2:40-405(+)
MHCLEEGYNYTEQRKEKLQGTLTLVCTPLWYTMFISLGLYYLAALSLVPILVAVVTRYLCLYHNLNLVVRHHSVLVVCFMLCCFFVLKTGGVDSPMRLGLVTMPIFSPSRNFLWVVLCILA